MAALLAGAALNSPPAVAQSTATTESRIRFDIPAGPLSGALNRIAEAGGVQFLYSSALTEGLKSSGFSGTFTVGEAIARVLAGTGLTYRFMDAHTVAIQKAVEGNTRTLGPVQVEGRVGSGTAGVNGSKDPTATEDTGSYTSSALTVGSKTVQSMRETPRSVSVITQQRMEDQNLTDFSSVMNQATGVTTVFGGSGPLNASFVSRGFNLTQIQVDGGAPLATAGIHPSNSTNNSYAFYAQQLDMALYDHIEFLRGPDGLFNGYGSPGGSINLVRKRPLDHAKVSIEGALASWNNQRVMLDATGPLGFDGRFRGRGIVSYQTQDYFYDDAKTEHTTASGTLEADVTPISTVTVGFELTNQSAVPWVNGLPRYENGDDLGLPRSASVVFPWNRRQLDTKMIFAQLEQEIGSDWTAKLKVTRLHQTNDQKYGAISGPVNPVTHLGPTLNGSVGTVATLQKLAEFTLSGGFDFFGLRQRVTVGGNYVEDGDGGEYRASSALFSSKYVSPTGTVGPPPVDVFNFNPDDPTYAEPASIPPTLQYANLGQQQWGTYMNFELMPLKRLHFISGFRFSHYSGVIQNVTFNSQGVITGVGSLSRYSTHDFSWPPSYSLVYDLSPVLSVYGTYADVYQPQINAVDYSLNRVGPVTGGNFEGGFKSELFDGKTNATLSLYRQERKNYAKFLDVGAYAPTNGFLPDGLRRCCYTNSNQVDLSQGVDLDITGQLLPGWQLSAGYAYNMNKLTGSDAYGANFTGPERPLVSLSPKHLLKVFTDYRFRSGEWLRNLSVGGGIIGQTRAFTSGSACTAYDYGTDPVTGREIATCRPGATVPFQFAQARYATGSLRVAYQIDRNWSASLNLENITDRRYYRTMGISSQGNWYGDPRNYALTFRGKF